MKEPLISSDTFAVCLICVRRLELATHAGTVSKHEALRRMGCTRAPTGGYTHTHTHTQVLPPTQTECQILLCPPLPTPPPLHPSPHNGRVVEKRDIEKGGAEGEREREREREREGERGRERERERDREREREGER